MLRQMNRTAITVERVGSLADLLSLRGAWNDLQRENPFSLAMVDHRWMCAWWRAFGDRYVQHTLVLRHGSEILGVAPLMISRGMEVFPTRDSLIQTAHDYRAVSTRLPRLVPIRRLTFPLSIVSGNLRCQFLFRTDDSALYDAVVTYAASISRQWDLMMLEGLPAPSGQKEQVLASALRHGLSTDGREFERPLLRVSLPETFDLYLAQRPARFRRELGKARRRVKRRVGRLTFREFRGVEIGRGMDLLFQLEERSWKAKRDRQRRLYVPLDDRLRGFYRGVAEEFAAADEAQVLIMSANQEAVASLFCLEQAGRSVALLTYLDDAFRAEASALPLFEQLIALSIERGLEELDLNGFTKNLLKWANGQMSYSRLTLYNPRLYSQLLRSMARSASAAADLWKRVASRRVKARPAPRSGFSN